MTVTSLHWQKTFYKSKQKLVREELQNRGGHWVRNSWIWCQTVNHLSILSKTPLFISREPQGNTWPNKSLESTLPAKGCYVPDCQMVTLSFIKLNNFALSTPEHLSLQLRTERLTNKEKKLNWHTYLWFSTSKNYHLPLGRLMLTDW